jgi:hypothetical protein
MESPHKILSQNIKVLRLPFPPPPSPNYHIQYNGFFLGGGGMRNTSVKSPLNTLARELLRRIDI